jgi:hypothetical protein
VARDTSTAAQAMKPALRALADGDVVALYPEGRITTEPDYRPCRRPGPVRYGSHSLPTAPWCPSRSGEPLGS